MIGQNKVVKEPKQRFGFSKIGGLDNHLKILRDILIIPLICNNVYTYFEVKAPKGILFYGPPGTGKTLVAGALATEINKISSTAKIGFVHCRSTDVLDKWVGESEKKLKHLFDNAIKNRPSVLFFDEIDGLAPKRTDRTDQYHCSIVTTLLGLMDGLDAVPGVIVIGATNRIDAVDPALRRPGRFDRELYFPLPSTGARKHILQVHTESWKEKPSTEFMSYLADITVGFCGSDLQALCAEALLCGLKRIYPNLESCKCPNKIDANNVKLDECDFLNARRNLVPSSKKLGAHMRELSPIVRPLLDNQINTILKRIQLLWPHFFIQFHKYLIENNHYIGKVILIGSSVQGLYSHIIPAILHKFEHLPTNFVDLSNLNNDIDEVSRSTPSILVLPRVDNLWLYLENQQQIALNSSLEDLHPSVPVLIIATCETTIPSMLQNFFYNSTSIVVEIKNPTDAEIEEFFMPLFFDASSDSLNTIWKINQQQHHKEYAAITRTLRNRTSNVYNLKSDSGRITKNHLRNKSKRESPLRIIVDPNDDGVGDKFVKLNLSLILTKLIQRSLQLFRKKESLNDKRWSMIQQFKNSKDDQMAKIFELWQRTLTVSKNLPIAQLEVVYDSIATCIGIYRNDLEILLNNIEKTLNDVENWRKD